jgi:glutathione S-transferase
MLRFRELSPSPNNIKVRMALRYKGIDFEAMPVDPFDRKPLREVSGQDLSPVIEDKGIVLNDSEAILPYLDANYPGTPRLFPADRSRKQCDAWKTELDSKIVPTWLPVFLKSIGRSESFEAESRDGFEEFLAWLDGELGRREGFGAPDAVINDLRAAEWAVYALPGRKLVERVRLFRVFKENFAVPEGKYKRLEAFLEPWNERLG